MRERLIFYDGLTFTSTLPRQITHVATGNSYENVEAEAFQKSNEVVSDLIIRLGLMDS